MQKNNMRKQYNMSDKRKQSDIKQANWDIRLYVLIKRNQGWAFQKIADAIGISRQRANAIYQTVEHMTVEEAERLAQ